MGTSNLTPAVVVRWVVKCLYVDKALPRGPLLQWYLQLIVGTKFNHKQVRQFIDSAAGVYAEPSHGKRFNFTAMLEVPPPGFAGFVGEDEVAASLTPEVWDEVVACLGRGGWPKADDASHNYYFVAGWLQDESPIFAAMSFGRVLGIVRYSSQTTGLLGHRGGLLVPYAQSEEYERRTNALTGLPTHVSPGEKYVKTWQELQECLRVLLHEQRKSCLEVSQLKSLFRARHNRELSETVFGHECLSQLLADSRLSSDLSFETAHGNRYVLRLARSASRPPTDVAADSVAMAPPPPPQPCASSASYRRPLPGPPVCVSLEKAMLSSGDEGPAQRRGLPASNWRTGRTTFSWRVMT
eukprot:NODE_8413_length_1497_cov_8.408029.p1 GENE.NODE_8413_length_1497_cov_8.408029~~NODE_8413_length_1497_cov_8.408029.p1  ORF type:complete len:394 (-),score=57.27 NODE_8413_length_1497_cov_8.408029:316-1374(-)